MAAWIIAGVLAAALAVAGWVKWSPTGRRRRRCWHHDRVTGTSWLTDQLIDAGRCKMWTCSACTQIWFT